MNGDTIPPAINPDGKEYFKLPLLSLKEITVSFGGPKVLDNISLQVENGERIALLGRNGEGKTTFMRIMAGELNPVDGTISRQKGINIAFLPQEVPTDIKGNVFDIVLSGLGDRAKLLSDYHALTHRMQNEHSDEIMKELGRLQSELDHTGGWDITNMVENVISRLKVDADKEFELLSGGQKRRVLMAKAFVLKPEVLLLDEPTNHLDIDSIGWLEDFIRDYQGTVVFVTHDRSFMTRVATRIIELDRGRIFNWACGYKVFLERKQKCLDAEAARSAEFEKKLAKEEQWIRRGVKARRCREEGRVNALMKMRAEKRAQRKEIGNVRFKAQETDISGRLVIKTFNLGFSYGDHCIIKELETEILRGDKIGIIGPNGSGKTTLINLLLQKIKPQKGKVKLGTNLEIAYYDQLREQLDEEKTVMENVSGESETVFINGKPKHIIGYLQEFLFTPDRARTPVKVLSGGERNRLLLARLFTRPFNLLVMDEPTNDLDIETLELLEELLLEFTGTLLLVSHDRTFLNNVVTSTMVLEGGGAVNEYPGGYDDWLDQRKETVPAKKAEKKAYKKVREKTEKPLVPRKLSLKEKMEFEGLPARIEKLEVEQKQVYGLLADLDFCQKNPQEIGPAKLRAEALEKEIITAYERWEYLSNVSSAKGDIFN